MTHLYVKYNYKLLDTVAIYRECHSFPMAYALIDEETILAWTSYKLQLLNAHAIRSPHPIYIINN